MKKLIPSITSLFLVTIFISQFGPGYVYAKKSGFYKEFIVIEKSNDKVLKLGEAEICGYLTAQLDKLDDSLSGNEIFFLSNILFSNHFSGYYLGNSYQSYSKNHYYGSAGGGYLQKAALVECVDCSISSIENSPSRYIESKLLTKVKSQFSELNEQASCQLDSRIENAFESWISYLD